MPNVTFERNHPRSATDPNIKMSAEGESLF